MIMDILAQRLEDHDLGKREENIFYQQFPGDIDVGVFFRYPLTGVKIDPYIPGWYKVRMQVIARHTSVTEGDKYADKILKALTFQGDQTFPANDERPEVRLSLFYPENLPIRYPRLEGNTLEWSMHFNTVFSTNG